MTRDQFNQKWFIELSSAKNCDELARMVSRASRDAYWNGAVAKHVCAMLVLLSHETP